MTKASNNIRSCSRLIRTVRHASTATLVSTQQPLTLLYKTSALLPRAISEPHTLKLWRDILDSRHQELSSTPNRTYTRIAVYGTDARAQEDARAMFAALLQDPFGSQDIASTIISKTGSFTVELGETMEDNSSIRVPSAYFQQFARNVQLHFVETTPGSIPAEVYKADASIVICNPLTSSAPNMAAHSRCAVVYVAPTIPSKPDRICVDPTRALSAVQQLRSTNTTSTAGIQRYQDNFTSSGLDSITNFIRDNLAPDDKTAAVQAALASVHASWSICEDSLQKTLRELGESFVESSQLEERVDEHKVRAYGEVLGKKSKRNGQDEDQVTTALQEAEKSMQQVMQRLNWWRMVWRVDELGLTVGNAVERAWCKNLEKQLILQTGRLSALQQSLSEAADRLLSSTPLRSAVLSNSISQLKASPQFPLSPRSLTHPVHTRMNQIIEYPTTRLHLAGQRSVLGFGSSVTVGAGLSWADWMGYLADVANVGTGTAVGALTTVLGLRWAVGVWERAKVRWWEDWKRVGDGLSRDLKGELERVMTEQVTIVPTRAYEGLMALAVERKQQVLEVQEDLRAIKKESGLNHQ